MKILTVNGWSGLDYNGLVKMGEYESSIQRKARFHSLVTQLRNLSPDVIFVQEANPAGSYAADLASALAMVEIHQIVNGGIKAGPLGIPINLKEGLVILAKPELELRKVDSWKLSGSKGIHSDILTLHFDEAVMALVGRINAGGHDFYLVNVHLVAAPKIPNNLTDFKKSVLAGGEMGDTAFDKALELWQRRQQRRMGEIETLLANLQRLPSGAPCVVGGDFNADPDSMEMKVFRDRSGFTEGLEVVEKDIIRNTGTFTWDPDSNENIAFSTRTTDARGLVRKSFDYLAAMACKQRRRLDYIFIGEDLLEVGIVNRQVVLKERVNGVQASDHFGVLVEVGLSPWLSTISTQLKA